MRRIQLKDGSNGYEVVGEIEREPMRRAGYEVIRYRGCIYQLLGGIRGPEFINVAHPKSCSKRRGG